MARKSPNAFAKPFSVGYAYAQTQHYRDAVAAQRAEIADPFEGFESEAPAAEPEPAIPAQRPAAPMYPATDAQVSYALSLAARKGNVTGEDIEATVRAMGRREASALIDRLKALPDAPRETAKAPEVTEGMYRDPATGEIFKVQVAHHGSGRLYAKQLVKLDEVRIKRNKEYSHDFEYVSGLVNRIKPEWRMTRDEAAEWGRLYGACCKCGTILTDEKSIAAGIGPICADGF